MKFHSTRSDDPQYSLKAAITQSMAPDGGLFIPDFFPRLAPDLWNRGTPLVDTARGMLAPFVEGVDIGSIAKDALTFPIPLIALNHDIYLLELFHGPTLAFKDIGARFMARLVAAYGEGNPDLTVLVATSGDTGGAVADAFYGVTGTRVVVLYPEGKVSPRQERQFATLGGNVTAVAVRGAFDHCQKMVKEAFADRALVERHSLTSANSINLGRLLPQMTYYGHAVAQLPPQVDPEEVLFCTPSGNFGNLTAGLWARASGLPIHHFLAAVNANDVVPEYLQTGLFSPRDSIATLANAMDVGNPSNLARIRHLFGNRVEAIGKVVRSSSHLDAAIGETISRIYREEGRIIDPHTAVGFVAVSELRRTTGEHRPTVILSTAHPAKFAEVVEPIIGESIPVPPSLAAGFDRPLKNHRIEPQLDALVPVLDSLG